MLLNIYINNLDDGTECICSKFTDDRKLGGVADKLNGSAALERNLDKGGEMG